MPRNAIDYTNTRFYKIVCLDLTVDGCYVGHTTNFSSRKSVHKHNCSNEKNLPYLVTPLFSESTLWADESSCICGNGFGGDHQIKSDLLAIFPAKLREDHLLTAVGRESYLEFRDLVLTQTSYIFFNSRRGGGAGFQRIEHKPASSSAL